MEHLPKGVFVVMRRSDSGARVIGEPVVKEPIPVPAGQDGCPACGSLRINMMQVDVENEHLTTGKGVASFAKCANPGCDWESEMAVRAV